MTTKHVDWKAFKKLVEDDLVRVGFIRDNLDDAFKVIRKIINDNLEVYVDSQFINQFHIDIGTYRNVIKIGLRHDTDILCNWEV